MASFIFSNNVSTTLAGSISATATSLTLASSANLPSSIPNGYVYAITLNDAASHQVYEIIYATGISGATLTFPLGNRGQEGTAAQAWAVGDFAFNGVTAGQMQNLSSGRLLGPPTILTAASGTFTPNPNANMTIVEGTAAGGAGGGAVVTGSSTASVGSGGTCGAYAKFVLVGAISGTVAYTCGAGGTGVSGAAGNAGGQSTFGSYATLPGGFGGSASAATPPPFFGSGSSNTALPTLTGVTEVLSSLPGALGGGAFGLTLSASTNSPGRGNNNPLGIAPNGGYGTGGNGASNGASSAAQAGTVGFNGEWIIYEFA